MDSFIIAHCARKQSAESALYNDQRLWEEFKAAWTADNLSTIEATRPQPDAGPEDTDKAAKRSRKATARKAEKLWQQELDERARTAFKKAIASVVNLSLPAPS